MTAYSQTSDSISEIIRRIKWWKSVHGRETLNASLQELVRQARTDGGRCKEVSAQMDLLASELASESFLASELAGVLHELQDVLHRENLELIGEKTDLTDQLNTVSEIKKQVQFLDSDEGRELTEFLRLEGKSRSLRQENENGAASCRRRIEAPNI